MPREIVFSEVEQQAIIDLYESGSSCEQIARRVGACSASLISNKLRKWGIRIRSNSEAQRKYTRNDFAFYDETPESLYWAGFLLADGNVYKRAQASPLVQMNLKDREHLEKFARFIECDLPIVPVRHHGYDLFYFGVKSEQMASDLERYGVVPRKSLVAQIPQWNTTALYSRDFWRGYCDGNCSLFYECDGKEHFTLTCGSDSLLIQFNEFLEYRGLHRMTAYRRLPYETRFCDTTGIRTRRLATLLYANAPYECRLDRKYAVAEQMMIYD